jgi:hypothetical protein
VKSNIYLLRTCHNFYRSLAKGPHPRTGLIQRSTPNNRPGLVNPVNLENKQVNDLLSPLVPGLNYTWL